MHWKFVDRITETDGITHIKGKKRFPLNEVWHEDHFPGSPIVPGVLQIEVVANLAGKLILLRNLKESTEWVAPILLKTGECRFKDLIRPGELINVEVSIEKYNRRLVCSTGTLYVDNKERANISVTSARIPVETIGDPTILIPWKIREILEVYPDMREEMRNRLEQELTQIEDTLNFPAKISLLKQGGPTAFDEIKK